MSLRRRRYGNFRAYENRTIFTKISDDFLLAGPGYYSGAPIRSLEMLQTGENGMGCEGRVPDVPYELQDEYMAVIDEKVTLCKESTKKALFHL